MARRFIDFNKPKPFSPAFTRRVLTHAGAVLNKNAQDLSDSNILSTSSFRYDMTDVGIRSTQQLDVDFSRFENHTFFSSAEANVNVAFQKIINEYPFDGTRREIEEFLDSLSGFEKYVLDSYPKNIGYLNFSGSSSPLTTEGTYIVVNDYAGFLYPSISKKRSGENIIDPGLKSFSIEMHLFIPTATNDNQVVCQKMSGSQQGITLAVSRSLSTSTCNIVFAVTSGTYVLSASAPIEKGRFNHIVATLDRHPGINEVMLYVDESLISTSDSTAELGQIGFVSSPFLIGSGTTHAGMHSASPSIPFIPLQTLSGSIDELRVFHGTRGIKEQQLYGRKTIYASPDLKLCFKFNEPSGSIGTDTLVIDSSGNSLHSLISNFSQALRVTGTVDGVLSEYADVPMTYESKELNPVLFPAYVAVTDYNAELLSSASLYDSSNPNMITKLVPSHYFQEGQMLEAFENEDGTIGDAIDQSGPPGSFELGSAQLLTAFLYVWARHFDEVKMMIDQFGSVIHVDYDKKGFTANQFLQFLAKYYGFDIPAFFVDSSIEQYTDAQNIGDTVSRNELSLQYVQNQLWRRILTNIGDVIRSKGTLHSIGVLLRSMGIEPGQGFRVREYGGQTFRNLEDSRENRAGITTLLNFSGTLALNPVAENAHGFSSTRPWLISPYLSSSRQEPGYPNIRGTFVNVAHGINISNNENDGLWTSGSWTCEATYRFQTLLSGSHHQSQSLMRLHVTGTNSPCSSSGGVLANLLAMSGSGLTLYVCPTHDSVAGPTLVLNLTSSDVMDGRVWNVCFGRQHASEIGAYISSSYFIRAGRQEFGSIIENHVTSAFFFESGSESGASINAFNSKTAEFNASGSFIVIGSQSITTTATDYLNSTAISSDARYTIFDGLVGQIRFWSKALTSEESSEHIKNFRSVGVDDQLTNFNFVTSKSGSFERLRMDVSLEQYVTKSDSAGTIYALDYSQNNIHMTGSGFEPLVNVFYPQRMFYSQLSPRFDEAATNNKVRIRSFKSFENVQLYGGEVAPIYEIARSEQPNDDVRFSIDFSIADALNDDIIKIFSTLSSFDNALGNPELLFSPDYPALEDMRDVYFNRLTGRVRLRQFFEFFKWFDSVLGVSTFIEQLIPRKTRFLGTNFVVESHMIERAKLEYLYTDIYLGENNRHYNKQDIKLQQFSTLLKRF